MPKTNFQQSLGYGLCSRSDDLPWSQMEGGFERSLMAKSHFNGPLSSMFFIMVTNFGGGQQSYIRPTLRALTFVPILFK